MRGALERMQKAAMQPAGAGHPAAGCTKVPSLSWGTSPPAPVQMPAVCVPLVTCSQGGDRSKRVWLARRKVLARQLRLSIGDDAQSDGGALLALLRKPIDRSRG